MSKSGIASIVVSAFLMGACAPSTSPAPESALGPSTETASPPAAEMIDQEHLCEVSRWQHDVAKEHCEPGQKILYLPESFGNEQLPILFAAVNCDLRYSVALTKGAVTCIYAPINVEPENSAPPLPGPVVVPPQP